MFGSIWTAAALSCAAPLPLAPRADDATKPKLLVKGKEYLVHALPPKPDGDPLKALALAMAFDKQTVVDGLVVLHTALGTGEMKILAAGQTVMYQAPPMGLDRSYSIRSVVAGVAGDEERLFILQAETRTGQLYFTPGTTYRLLVFRPDTGARIHMLELKEGDFPKGQPADALDTGPLVLRGDGVACFGVTFTFKGTELLKQEYEKKRR
jgi:hypothetical protein